jgi:molybdopterin converting factor small subunit
MTIVRIPTPLRPYTDGLKEIMVEGETVGMLIQEIASRYPQIQPHLFDESGALRAYVNLFLNHEDVRLLDGDETPVTDGDNLMIVPSIAGGSTTIDPPPFVDHAALRTNQAVIISLLLIAFIIDLPLLALVVALIMLSGTVTKKPGFLLVYQGLRRLRFIKPEVLPDHPEPHQFAQGFGAVVLLLSFSAASFGLSELAWILVWIVVVLAGVNLFFGFCVGCAMYYWFNRLGLPFFHLDPPGDRIPGARPPKA